MEHRTVVGKLPVSAGREILRSVESERVLLKGNIGGENEKKDSGESEGKCEEREGGAGGRNL